MGVALVYVQNAQQRSRSDGGSRGCAVLEVWRRETGDEYKQRTPKTRALAQIANARVGAGGSWSRWRQ